MEISFGRFLATKLLPISLICGILISIIIHSGFYLVSHYSLNLIDKYKYTATSATFKYPVISEDDAGSVQPTLSGNKVVDVQIIPAELVVYLNRFDATKSYKRDREFTEVVKTMLLEPYFWGHILGSFILYSFLIFVIGIFVAKSCLRYFDA